MEILSSRILLRPADLERSLSFYEEVLGLHVYREFGSGESRGVVFFLGGGFLEVSGRGGPVRAEGLSLWLQVRSVEAAEEQLREAGAPIDEPATKKPWGLVEMRARDPDGVGLVFVEVPPSHPLRRDQRG